MVTKNSPAVLLIEQLVAKRRLKTVGSVFDNHYRHHEKTQVDKTSFQAERLGLKYLGFGRYGQIKDKNNSKSGFRVTHIVRNGLLVPVKGKFTTDTDEYIDDNDFIPKLKSAHIKKFYDTNTKEMQKYVEAMDDGEKKDFTNQIKALGKYIGVGYVDINKILFNGLENKAHPHLMSAIRRLDNMFHNDYAKVKTDLPLYTGTTANIEKGKSYIFKGFLSTSLDPKIAYEFTNPSFGDDSKYHVDNEKLANAPPVVIQIDVKKGQRALDINSLMGAAREPSLSNEKEFILPRNSYINVTDGPIHLKDVTFWKAELDQSDDDFDDTETPLD